MARIIFVNRFMWPDQSATSQILSDLCFHLAGEGREIHVVTSRLHYGAGSSRPRLAGYENVRGVHIHRVRTSATGRRLGLAGRAVDYASFYAPARWAVSRLARKGDIVVVKTDPPLLSVWLAGALEKRGVKLVTWTQDLYPEIAQGLGVTWLNGSFGRLLTRRRDASFKMAAAHVAIGSHMQARIADLGVPQESVRVIPNWIDETRLAPVERATNPLRVAWELGDRFVVGYSGNLGRAHEFETLLGAADHLRQRQDLCFLVLGGGHHVEALRRAVTIRGLEALFAFRPYQDQETLSNSLSAADVHWVSLRPQLEGLIVPSKIYGIAAVARPMIAIMDLEGEVGQLIARHECGAVVAPGDSLALARAISAMQADPMATAQMGQRARAMLEAQFSRGQALAAWSTLLNSVAAAR